MTKGLKCLLTGWMLRCFKEKRSIVNGHLRRGDTEEKIWGKYNKHLQTTFAHSHPNTMEFSWDREPRFTIWTCTWAYLCTCTDQGVKTCVQSYIHIFQSCTNMYQLRDTHVRNLLSGWSLWEVVANISCTWEKKITQILNKLTNHRTQSPQKQIRNTSVKADIWRHTTCNLRKAWGM